MSEPTKTREPLTDGCKHPLDKISHQVLAYCTPAVAEKLKQLVLAVWGQHRYAGVPKLEYNPRPHPSCGVSEGEGQLLLLLPYSDREAEAIGKTCFGFMAALTPDAEWPYEPERWAAQMAEMRRRVAQATKDKVAG